jgi:hypothetical protein
VIAVTTRSGERLGALEGKLSARLIELQSGGNEYAIATIAVHPERRELRVLVRELRQSPQLAGRVSFPAETTSGFRAYIKGSVIREERLEDEDEEALEDTDTLIPEEEELSADSDTIDFNEEITE